MAVLTPDMWQAIGLTALPYLGGLYGGYVTRHQVKTWYPTLVKPSWRPPNAAFPVVWTCLYTGMGSVDVQLVLGLFYCRQLCYPR